MSTKKRYVTISLLGLLILGSIVILMITINILNNRDKKGARDNSNHMKKNKGSFVDENQKILDVPAPKDELEKMLYNNKDGNTSLFSLMSMTKEDNLKFLEALLNNPQYKNLWGEAMYGLTYIDTDNAVDSLIPKYLELGEPYLVGETRVNDRFWILMNIGFMASSNDRAYNFLKQACHKKYWKKIIKNWQLDKQRWPIEKIPNLLKDHAIQAMGISGREEVYSILYDLARRTDILRKQGKSTSEGVVVTSIYYWDVNKRFGIDKLKKMNLVDLDLYQEWQKHRPAWMKWYRKEGPLPSYLKEIPWHKQKQQKNRGN